MKKYLLRIAKGKDEFIGAILRKYNIETKKTEMGGFLVCDGQLPPSLLYEFKPYIHEVIQVSEMEAEMLMRRPKESNNGLKEGVLVEVIGGIYQDFKGIVRKVKDGCVQVDLNLFGRVIPVEVSPGEVKVSRISGPWV